MSKSAGNIDENSSNVKKCEKFKLKFLKCQKVLENPNFFVLKMSNFAYCVLLGFYRFFLIASHSCMTCVTRSLFLKIPTENTQANLPSFYENDRISSKKVHNAWKKTKRTRRKLNEPCYIIILLLKSAKGQNSNQLGH